METEVAGKSSVDDATRKEVMDKAASVMAQGKRNVVCGEIPTAVNQFQEACKILAKTFGETAKECAEAYFCYGQALLDLARMETGVLGNALEGVPDEEEEKKEDEESEQFENPDKIKAEEREQLRKDVYDAMSEPDKENNKNSESTTLDINGGKTEASDADGSEKMDCENSESAEKEMKDTDKASSETPSEKNVSTDKSDVPKVELDKKKTEKEGKTEEQEASSKDNVTAETTEKVEGKEASSVDKGNDSTSKSEEVKNSGEETEKMEMEVSKDEKDTVSENKEESKDKKDAVSETKEKSEEKQDKESGKTDEDKENEEEGEGSEEGEDEEALDGEDTADEEKKDGEEDPDDIPNLQLAWEMLELAKVIYMKDEEKVAQLKAAQAYLKLGEVGLETEQYEQAIGDLNECLKIQKKLLESDDRLLAETYYQLGLAYSLDKQYEPAIQSYKGAIDVIESRIVNLKKIIAEKPTEEKAEESKKKETEEGDKKETEENDKKETEENDKKQTDGNDKNEKEVVASPEQELKELSELLPDIKAKIEDTEEEQKNLDQLKSMAKEIAGNAFEQLGNKPGESSTGFSSSSEPAKETAPASDITHLVRKKRKPEDDIPDEAGDCKKSKQEVELNGHVNGTNGTTEASEEKAMEITEKKVEDVTAPVQATS